MTSRPLAAVLVLGFAVAVGDFGFRTFNPSPTSEYMIEVDAQPYSLATEGEPKKHLYLRRTWRLTEPPEQAWIKLVGHDVIEVWVNGRRAGYSPPVGCGRTTGVVMDISPLMHAGENCIAIHAAQLVLDRPPAVVVEGEARFAAGEPSLLNADEEWKAADIYERRGQYWYESDFNEEHWANVHVGDRVQWRAQIALPPRAIIQPRLSKWITTPGAESGAAVVAKTFDVAGQPREGWLRVSTTGSERVALNGRLLTDVQADLGTQRTAIARELTFDVSPLLRRGENVVSIMSETSGEPPRVMADLEATTVDGERTYIATDATWKGSTGFATDWLTPEFDHERWTDCSAQFGYQGVVPRALGRELLSVDPPGAFWFIRAVVHAMWIVGSGLVAAAGAFAIAALMDRRRPPEGAASSALAFVALLPSTIAAATGAMMTWDLAWSAHDVYQRSWLAALWFLVPAQWLSLLLLSPANASVSRHSDGWQWSRRARWTAAAVGWLALGSLALWLRLRDLTAEPIHHDEVTVYAFTETVFTQGFPGGQVHPDIPFGYAATNELCYFFNALSELIFDDPLLVIRVPSVVWSMLTMAFLAYLGWKWFDGYVGVVAATLR